MLYPCGCCRSSAKVVPPKLLPPTTPLPTHGPRLPSSASAVLSLEQAGDTDCARMLDETPYTKRALRDHPAHLLMMRARNARHQQGERADWKSLRPCHFLALPTRSPCCIAARVGPQRQQFRTTRNARQKTCAEVREALPWSRPGIVRPLFWRQVPQMRCWRRGIIKASRPYLTPGNPARVKLRLIPPRTSHPPGTCLRDS